MRRSFPTSTPPRRAPQRGVMLIEVLASILIFSLGILALVGLQARMTTMQSESKYRADASYLANEAIGLMWSDLTHLTSYNDLSCASYVRCKDWQDKVAASLPNGTARVVINGSSQMVTVTLTWRHASDDQRTYSTRTRIASAS